MFHHIIPKVQRLWDLGHKMHTYYFRFHKLIKRFFWLPVKRFIKISITSMVFLFLWNVCYLFWYATKLLISAWKFMQIEYVERLVVYKSICIKYIEHCLRKVLRNLFYTLVIRFISYCYWARDDSRSHLLSCWVLYVNLKCIKYWFQNSITVWGIFEVDRVLYILQI